MSFKNCTEVSPTCPVKATTYGYYPDLGPNAALLAFFAVCCIAQLALGLWKRVYSYSIALAIGALMEALGYAGRLMMHDNPWNLTGFKIQVICLLIAPSFIAAGIYLTVKHFVLHNNPELSLLRPKLYTWVFIGCDIASFLVQAAGGGVAASATGGAKLRDIGNNIMVAGIAFQIVTMVLCGVLAGVYMFRRWRCSRGQDTSTAPRATVLAPGARIFLAAVVFAYITVLVRCIYRLPEMVGGWGNELMRNEKEFLALDGLMIVLATIALTVAHPAYFFPVMKTGYHGEEEKFELTYRTEGSSVL